MTEHPFLQVEKVSKHFGGINALSQVSLRIEKNQIKGLIGPNGAGKTTLFNVMSGFSRVSSGDIVYQGKSITHLPAYRIAGLGLTRTFQNVKLFPNLTVLENVLVGGFSGSKNGMLSVIFNLPQIASEEKKIREEAMGILDFIGLSSQYDLNAAALPFGQQRLLEIARALITNPELLLLDEPAAGLSAPERAGLTTLIRKIRDRGITVLLVEHDMGLVMKVCEEIAVLEFGVKIAEGTPESIRQNRKVIAAYLGGENGYAANQ